MRMSEGLRGSISTELIPGCSPPATPNHCRRSGICQSGSFSDHDSPPSSERNSPPGIVPAHSRPGTPPGSSAQILPSDQGWGSSPASSGFGGNAGTGSSRQLSAAVAAPQLGPEMAEIERGIDGAVGARQHRGKRVAEKMRVGDFPAAVMARDLEQTLVGRDIEPVRHPLLH